MKVLITDRLAISALERLKSEPSFEVTVGSTDDDVEKYEAMLIRSRTKVDKDLLQRSKSLKYVITSTSGFDHIDFKACAEKGIKVFYTPEANAISAAELTWALITNLMRKIKSADELVKKGVWDRSPLVGRELYKKTLGIIGLGRVGKRVARIANAFEMHVIACDPYVDDNDFKVANAERASWDEVLKSSDILTLHVPLTKETKNLINFATLDSLNHGAILINTSRGGVVSEVAVIEAVKKGKISALGMDVFEREPLPKDSALLSLPNILLTPHIGANTVEAFDRGSQAAVDKILSLRQGKKVCDEITKEN